MAAGDRFLPAAQRGDWNLLGSPSLLFSINVMIFCVLVYIARIVLSLSWCRTDGWTVPSYIVCMYSACIVPQLVSNIIGALFITAWVLRMVEQYRHTLCVKIARALYCVSHSWCRTWWVLLVVLIIMVDASAYFVSRGGLLIETKPTPPPAICAIRSHSLLTLNVRGSTNGCLST
jgi:hypothetical protein